MKRIVFILIAAVFALILSTSVYAGSLSVADFYMLESKSELVSGFEIASGISTDEENVIEKTFDKTRTFGGKAPRDSVIEITVYSIARIDYYDIDIYEDYQPMLIEENSYILTVGPSGMFTQTVDLCMGENYIVAQIESGDMTSVKSTVIKRKDQDIMREKSIVLPGQGSRMQVD